MNFNLTKIFYFGEKIKEYSVRVLNEREIRASAGILFLFAIIGFLNIVLKNNFLPMKIFVTLFLIDFIIRVLINPKFSPTLILGRLIVSNQDVEYVGAPQKKFAWIIGLILGLYVFTNLVIFNSVGLLSCSICIICLIFLFFETSLGICLGCKVYPLFSNKKMELCAGGTCEVKKKEKIQKTNITQLIILFLFLLLAVFLIISAINLSKLSVEKTSVGVTNQNNQLNQESSGFNLNANPDGCVLTKKEDETGTSCTLSKTFG